MAATLVLCGVGGWLLSYPELVALSGACAATLAVALLSVAGRIRLSVERSVAPAKVQRCAAAVGTLRVANAGRSATRPIRAVDRIGEATVQVGIPALARRAAGTVGYRLPTSRRGRLPVGPLLLRADDPFGLVRRVLVVGESTEVLVRPRTVPLAPPAYGRRASLEGPTARNAPSGTATFHTLRAYVPGDDLRHVHWRTTARTNTLMVKHLVDSALPESAVIIDTRATSYADPETDFDIALDAAATITAGMANLGYPVVVMTTSGQRIRVRGTRAVEALLDHLALIELDESQGDLDHAVERAHHVVAAGGGLIVATGTRSPTPAQRLAAAGRRFERTLLLRAGAERPGEQHPGTLPGIAAVGVTDAEEAASAWRSVRLR